jgi:hypothetical protein
MLLTVFVLAQLTFDVLVVVVGLACLVRRRSGARPQPALGGGHWPGESMQLTRDLLTLTESAIDALARRGDTAAATRETGGVSARRVEARLPGEQRLADNVAALMAVRADG